METLAFLYGALMGITASVLTITAIYFVTVRIDDEGHL